MRHAERADCSRIGSSVLGHDVVGLWRGERARSDATVRCSIEYGAHRRVVGVVAPVA